MRCDHEVMSPTSTMVYCRFEADRHWFCGVCDYRAEDNDFPLIEGGQGRSGEDVASDGASLLTLALLAIVVAAVLVVLLGTCFAAFGGGR